MKIFGGLRSSLAFIPGGVRELDKFFGDPPASKASRDVPNLIERKNPHTPI